MMNSSKIFLSDEQKTDFAYKDSPDLMLGALTLFVVTCLKQKSDDGL